ncbi:MAG: type II secretion system protein [Desulfosporosinus sp.]|nr:type II secretion system protein [Desulfosporosinus sp.]
MTNKKGFTLIEMLIVLAIIGIMLSMAYPSLARSYDSSKENDRARNEYVVNKALKQYYALNGKYPNQDHDRTTGFIPSVVADPITGKKQLAGELLLLNDALYEYTFVTLDADKYTYTYVDVDGDGEFDISSIHVKSN